MQIGCGVAGWFYFIAVVLGYVMFSTKLRKVPLYYMDVLLMLLFLIEWGISFPPPVSGLNQNEVKIQQYFPFILNGALAGLTLVGPLTYFVYSSMLQV